MSKRIRIAVLVDSVNSEYVMVLRLAMEKHAARRNVDLLWLPGLWLDAPSVVEATQSRIYGLVTEARFDGVIISSTLAHFCGAKGIQALCKRYAPLPTCSVGLAVEGFPSLVVDNAAGMAAGVRHLIHKHGCRRIFFIGGPPANPEAAERLAGYREALSHAGLPFSEELVESANFTMAGGAAAMRRCLDKGIAFDAVAAANDYMALAAIDELLSHGLKVPDIPICGFDDAECAAFAHPALTTLGQPFRLLGTRAIDIVLEQIQGHSPPEVEALPLGLVVRQSCGCEGELYPTVPPSAPLCESTESWEERRRREAIGEIRLVLDIPSDPAGQWAADLYDGLIAELKGKRGRFAEELARILALAQADDVPVDGFQRVLTRARALLKGYVPPDSDQARRMEQQWHLGRALVAAESSRRAGRANMDVQHRMALLGKSGERLSSMRSISELSEAIVEELPSLEIARASICLFSEEQPDKLIPLVTVLNGRKLELTGEPFPAEELAPNEVLDSAQYHSVVVPLTFDREFLGIAVLAPTAVPMVYTLLRREIGAAIKVAQLHHRFTSEVALRERVQRQHMTNEAHLAANIQIKVTPQQLQVPGLEVAASMRPAAEVGGDYYEVIPLEGGAWLGIGDVTGEGLARGLTMLMLQSTVSGIVQLQPDSAPSKVICAVNRALFDRIQQRLGRNDQASLVLLRYTQEGRVCFAGSHNPLLIYRAQQRRCEQVETSEFSIGATPAIEELAQDHELTLTDGDLLVLYTDGLIEHRNSNGVRFGIKRLTSEIEANAHRPVTDIESHLIQAIVQWSSHIEDDITVMVVRYHAPESRHHSRPPH